MTTTADTHTSDGLPEAWQGDHTALVHVLWGAAAAGLTLEDADDLARFIRRSQYQWATQQLSAAGRAPVTFGGEPEEHVHLSGAEQEAIAAAKAADERAADAAAAVIAESFGDNRAVAESAIAQFRTWLAKPRRLRRQS